MKIVLALVALASASASYADENPFRIGAQVSGGSYSASYIDGPSDGGTGVNFGLIGSFELGRGSRLLSSLSRSAYKTDATDVMIGQQVTDLEGSISYQAMWRLSRSIRPWIGAGIGYVKSSYRDRYVLASPGSPSSILLADADKSSAIGLLNVNFESTSGGDWSPGLQIQGGKAFSGKASYVRIGVYVLY
jgi:hypothetical protein